MKYRVFTVLALAVVLFSCKKEEGAKPDETVQKEVVQQMTVEMDVVQKTADNYAVYYTEDNTTNFRVEQTVWNEVKPSPETQTLVFSFPKEIFPTHLRFDIGNKIEREDVVLKKFKVKFADKEFEAKGSDFFKYFWGNDSIPTAIDQANGTITFLKKPNSKFIPYYNPNEAFVGEIKKLTH